MNRDAFTYKCPHCNDILNTNDHVHFVVREHSNSYDIYLSAEVGDYNYQVKPEISFETGTELEFFCPHCNENLKCEKYPDFVSIKLVISHAVDFEVLFSRKIGEQATYIITQDGVEKYGADKEVLKL